MPNAFNGRVLPSLSSLRGRVLFLTVSRPGIQFPESNFSHMVSLIMILLTKSLSSMADFLTAGSTGKINVNTLPLWGSRRAEILPPW
jgi:hypothetical protein